MAVDAKLVQELRKDTGAGMMDCKAALTECEGDLDKAKKVLREKGIAKAEKRLGRDVKEGLIDAYIHGGGRVGVLVELNCETDFVAKTDDFKKLAHEIAMQVAASAPEYVSPEDVPANLLEEEKSIYRKQALDEGKPEKILDKIIEGKVAKFYERVCLVDQPYIRDDSRKIKDLITETIAKTGENIRVKRFARFSLAEK